MKRSRSLNLVLMAGTGLALSACGEKPEPVDLDYYPTLDACVQEGKYTQGYCEKNWAAAEKQHKDAGPRYDSKRLCEEEFGVGRCEQQDAGAGADEAGGQAAGGSVTETHNHYHRSGGFWMPFMAGYAVSNVVDMIGDRRHNNMLGAPYVSPIYTGRYGTSTIGGTRLNYGRNGALSIDRKHVTKARPKAASKVRTRTSVISRGGFGSRMSGSRSSYGSRSFGG